MNTLLCVLFIQLSSPRTVTRDDLLSHSCGSTQDVHLHETGFAMHAKWPPRKFNPWDDSQKSCGVSSA